jgi:hypothetical protein
VDDLSERDKKHPSLQRRGGWFSLLESLVTHHCFPPPMIPGLWRNACGTEIEYQNAVFICIGVVEPNRLWQLDLELLHQSSCVHTLAAERAADANRIGIACGQRRRLQPDPVIHRVKHQRKGFRCTHPLPRCTGHRDLPLSVHRHIETCPLRSDIASRHLSPIRPHKTIFLREDCPM